MLKTTAAIVAICLAGLIALSVIGQEDPLPAVTPRAGLPIPLAEPVIALAVEPIHEIVAEPTLMSAARANDYLSFEALYAAARQRGEDVSQYETLHELWSWSMSDPIGSFYGRDLYERFSRAYPGYARYIADFAITDSRGNVFYPTSETRAFLLDRVTEGTARPRVRIAETTAPPRRQVERRPPPAAEPAAPSPVVATPPAPVVAETPTPAPVVTQPAPQPVTTIPAAEAAAAPPVAPPVAQPATTGTGRGILLVVIGLIGIGLLALVLRTPRETVPTKIIETPAPPPNNVEPMRKQPTQTPPPGTRATG